MVTISRELAAKRAETAAKWQDRFVMGAVPLMTAVLGLGFLVAGKNGFETASYVDIGLFILQGNAWKGRDYNIQRATNLRNDSIPASDMRAKEYRSIIHKGAHNLYRRLRSWS